MAVLQSLLFRSCKQQRPDKDPMGLAYEKFLEKGVSLL